VKNLAIKKTRFHNQRGNAMVETLPILIIFVVLLSFGLGFFGFVHTAVMNSIASRTYAFETFRNRSDVTFFRDRKAQDMYTHYQNIGNRFHTIDSEKKIGNSLGEGQFATTRDIAFGRKIATSGASSLDHNVKIYTISGRNRKENGVQASPAWVMVGYGLCIDANCGD
jgi:hypothetical protein